MLWCDLEPQLTKYINQGIFSNKELARLCKTALDGDGEFPNIEAKEHIEKKIAEHKSDLLSTMHYFSRAGTEEHNVRMLATKYLLTTLHGLSERYLYELKVLALKEQAQRYEQTLRAAQMSVKWDDQLTEKFITNVKKISEVNK